MDPRSSPSNYAEQEDGIFESKSNPNTSGTYNIDEDSAGYEKVTITADENSTANEAATAYENVTAEETATAYECLNPYEGLISIGSSSHYFPLHEGSWETQNISTPSERRDQNVDNSVELCRRNIAKILDALNTDNEDALDDLDLNGDFEKKDMPLGSVDENLNTNKLCRLIITLVMEADTGSTENSIDTLDLKKEIQKLRNGQKERLKKTAYKLSDVSQKLMELLGEQKDDDTEDLYLSNSVPSNFYETSHQNEIIQVLPQYDAPENEGSNEFLKTPTRFEGDLMEIFSYASVGEEIRPFSARKQKEEDTPSQQETTCCLNFRYICKSFCNRFFSFFSLGRKSSVRAIQTPTEQQPKHRYPSKSKKILPHNSSSEDTP